MMNKIVVVLSGGVVRTVLADNPEVEVEVLDFDNAKESLDGEEELINKLSEAEEELASVY
jgi:hypothetical protein